MTTIERVTKVLMETTPADQPPTADQDLFYDAKRINDEAHVKSGGYGLDSLDRVEVIMSVEEEFGLSVPDDAAGKFVTIRDIATWIDQQQGA